MVRKCFVAAIAASLLSGPGCAIESQTPGAGSRASADRTAATGMRPGRTPTQRPIAKPTNREIRGGGAHKTAITQSPRAGGQLDLRAVIAAAKVDLPAQLSDFDAADFDVISENTSQTLSGATLVHYTLQQKVAEIPIEGTYLRLTSRIDDRGAARLVATRFHLYQKPQVDTVAALNRVQAQGLAHDRLRIQGTARWIRGELRIRNVEGRLQLVWDLASRGSHYRAFVIASGAQQGRVLIEDGRIYQTTGTASALHVRGGAPGGTLGETVSIGMPNLQVTAENGATTLTDAAGGFSLDAAEGEPISAQLTGVAAQVFDIAGPNLSATATGGSDVALTFDVDPTDELQLAQTTAYVFTDLTRAYLEANGVPSDLLGEPLTVNVNLPSTCNAFYSSLERSINFFTSGGGCNNTTIDTVVAHEYGHFIDDLAGGITNGGLSEGWGDLLACYSLDTPLTGEDFFEDGGFVRTCENDYVFPPGGDDAVHALGQSWAGFAWRARLGFIDQFGPEEGDALARALVLPSLLTNAPDIPAAVHEVFLRDDDDGDLDNGTPHFEVLFAAAAHHGLEFAIELDFNPPGAITDLEALAVNATSVSLQWTASGDDGDEGAAATYDLRVSTQPIDESNFFLATPVDAPAPAEAGTVQTATVVVPPASPVFMAMIAVDENFNTSGLSNVISVTTPEGVTIYSEDVEDGAEDWTSTGLWHVTQRRASEGEQSFWYGQEDTGNYDTGDANAGELVSPVISLANADSPVLTFSEFIDVEDFAEFDIIEVTITNVDNPDQSVTFPKTTGTTLGQFQQRIVPLADFTDSNIQIRFRFDTIDNIANDLEGWYIDDLRISVSEEPVDECNECQPSDQPLDANECGECVSTVCAFDAFCCEVAWDQLCVVTALDLCDLTCDSCGDGICEPGEDCSTCPEDCGVCPCEHDLCEPGVPLDPTCDDCAASVCEVDPFCCDTFWDRLCVQEAEEICDIECTGCAHDLCVIGEPLDPVACEDTCVAEVCEFDAFCCEVAWDERCVTEANLFCGLGCEECVHGLCEIGLPLSPTCDPCVQAVCDVDTLCCSTVWDDRCIEQAGDICGLTCDDVPPSPPPAPPPVPSRHL